MIGSAALSARRAAIAIPIVLSAGLACAEQLSPEEIKKFGEFRNSQAYVEALLAAVMDQDQRLWPNCEKRQPVSRAVVEIVRPIKFGGDSPQPTEGFWGERVELDRCGTRSAQTAYFSVQDKIDVAPGLPGKTIANLELQVDTSKAVIEADLKKEKECRAREVIESEILTPPAAADSKWTERWTVAACGIFRKYDVTFTPKPNGNMTFAVSTAKN